jgi:TATA-box binding protein (TBP) (component of TFIID and TFIIIB)
MPELLDLFNGKKEVVVEQSTLTREQSKEKTESKKQVPAPKPTDLKLIIITCKTTLNSNINLEIIARQLKLDDEIKGKKLLGIVNEGLIKTKPKNYRINNKKKKRKRKSDNPGREDFSNQCTVLVKPNNFDKMLNLKIFGNGKIVITGGLLVEHSKSAVDIAKGKIAILEDDYQICMQTKLSDHFQNVHNYIKYITKNYLIFLKLFSLYGINLNLKLDLVLNKKLTTKYQLIDPISQQLIEKNLKDCLLEDLVRDQIIIGGSNEEVENYSRMIQVFNICHLYFTNAYFLTLLNDQNSFVHELIYNLYNFKKMRLPVTFEKEGLLSDHQVTIQNYNTMYDCGFHLDREAFTRILDSKYKSIISSVRFEPTKYQGINAKYVSRIKCRNECQSLGKKKTSKCPCKEISFLIFQEGKVIITGGRSWEQINDGYQIITNIMKDEYPSIVIQHQIRDSNKNKNLPPQIIKQAADDQKFVYLNKTLQIIENPRNYYLLKQLGILDKYL